MAITASPGPTKSRPGPTCRAGWRSSAAETGSPRLPSALAASRPLCALSRSPATEDEAARRHAGPRRDQHVRDVGDLVHRRAADLTNGLRHAVHAVDVRLAELAAVRVERQGAADLDVPV